MDFSASFFRIWIFTSTLVFSISCSALIEVIDDLNNKIFLAKPAKRIISLAPNITEILFHIGAGSSIVGADEYSNYPSAAQSIMRVNNHSIANYELIISLQPELVVAWHSGNGIDIIERLRDLGLPVFVLEISTMDQIPVLYQKLGQLTGNTKKSEEAAKLFSERLDSLRSKYAGRNKVKSFYQIWDDPIMTLNEKHLVSDVINLCGGDNVFSGAVPLVPQVNIESIIAANPEVILSSGSEARVKSWRQKWSRWPSIKAVRQGHMYLIPPDLMQRQSNRILDGADYVCQFLERYRQNKSSHI
jgi:iron complex transport system substrate-binding protein